MLDLISILTKLDSLQINVFTWRKGTLVGTDSLGNRYFRGRQKSAHGRERRWVIYKGANDPTAVPPEWSCWLHHTRAEPLSAESVHHKPWMRPNLPNPTGTLEAYRPPGHPLKGGQRAASRSDYEPWQPD